MKEEQTAGEDENADNSQKNTFHRVTTSASDGLLLDSTEMAASFARTVLRFIGLPIESRAFLSGTRRGRIIPPMKETVQSITGEEVDFLDPPSRNDYSLEASRGAPPALAGFCGVLSKIPEAF
jgi:hypothetical protein